MSTRVAPIFPVSDLAASLDYYRGLGFRARPWSGGGYGFLHFDGVEIHLGEEPDLDARPDRRSTAYLFVEDAEALAQTWVAAGGDVRLPEDTEWGQHEGRARRSRRQHDPLRLADANGLSPASRPSPVPCDTVGVIGLGAPDRHGKSLQPGGLGRQRDRRPSSWRAARRIRVPDRGTAPPSPERPDQHRRRQPDPFGRRDWTESLDTI